MCPYARRSGWWSGARRGGHYRIHTDASRVRDVGTALSAVYYLHHRPRGFEGGQLRLYDTLIYGGEARPAETYRTVEPEHDTLVFFPASAFHEVVPSTCPSGRFADHRFTLTTWISGAGPAGTAAPGTPSRIRQWMARAAEHTRPLADVTHDHDGARPTALPTTRLTPHRGLNAALPGGAGPSAATERTARALGLEQGRTVVVRLADGESVTLRIGAVLPDDPERGDFVVTRDLVRAHDPAALTDDIFVPADARASAPGPTGGG
ncbi:2OG-Fe(II) oxygenase [Streptomyces sp. NBC_00513]|uniref:2OG-Fe(II) oxygenase n=1 Tax=unclassified Streptomyces TaxID=2593676 RepID=UPI00224F8888|nr:2OG-Fe(II) oxygenase [Streptomyces sp. NBC_00424]MCX5071081.1 2OG-Fe(II) oxygenase [Streptomyces sp. NBC_00424]WUD45494.1 2OG-Fe(II) oxygenase [Streptomyces sp. NBC_00513]